MTNLSRWSRRARRGLIAVAAMFGATAFSLSATAQQAPTSAAARPELFAAGIIATGDEEFSPAFDNDGKTVYFTKGSPGRVRVMWIMVSHFRDGRWSDPEIAPFSGGYTDIDPTISVDGKRLVFASTRPLTGTTAREDFDLWMVERTADGWSEPRHMGDAVNSTGSESTTSFTADGTLYVGSAARPGGVPGAGRHLYRSRFVNGVYEKPEALPEIINAPDEVSNQYVAPDGSWMIFMARKAGETAPALYVTWWKDGTWSAPVNLDPEFNREFGPFTPLVSKDGKTLYFTSRKGVFDTLPPARHTAAQFHEAIRKPGNGLADIYSVPMSRFAAVLASGPK